MTAQPVVVLGAGHGTRMGRPKIFARYEGSTFLERILTRCRETASPVTLVVDPGFREKALALLTELRITPPAQPAELRIPPPPMPRLVDADGAGPMLASVQAALRQGGFDAGFWCWPVDAPFLSAPGWVMAVEGVQTQLDHIWKLSTGGETGHPVWFPGWAVPGILAGDWPGGLQGFMESNADRVLVLELEGEELRDFNTREQLAALRGSGEEPV